jgi:hypothetical protein
MNFGPLFTTAKVMHALYRITSTALLLVYIARKPHSKRPR